MCQEFKPHKFSLPFYLVYWSFFFLTDVRCHNCLLNPYFFHEGRNPFTSPLSSFCDQVWWKGWSDTTDETRVITLLVLTFKSLIPGNSTVPGKLRNVGHHTDGTSLCWWLIPVTPQSGFSFFSFSWKRQRLVNLEVHSSPFWKWSLFSSTTKHFLGKDWNRDNKNQIIVLWGSW